LMTTIRTRLGLSPDIEEGTKRQKHGDVLFHPLPEDVNGMPLGHVLSLVLTAMVRSRIEFPTAFMADLSAIGICVLQDDTPCFIEELVALSHERRPASVTLRNARIVTTGGNGPMRIWRAATQVAHAADGPVDAATPPSPAGVWVPPVGAAPWAVLGIPFQDGPPEL
jgi:hypothetical protein